MGWTRQELAEHPKLRSLVIDPAVSRRAPAAQRAANPPAERLGVSGQSERRLKSPSGAKSNRNGYSKTVVLAYFKEMGIPEPVFELQFHPKRKWRFDLAWPASKLFLEVQGGIFSGGRHNHGAAMLKEWSKLNAATVLGWRPLFCQPTELCMAETAAMIKLALSVP